MRQYLFLPSLILPAVLFYMPTSGVTEVDRHIDSIIHELGEEKAVKVFPTGIDRPVITVKKEEASVRFLNSIPSSAITIMFDEGALSSICGTSGSLQQQSSGFGTHVPLQQGESTTACFLNPGTYNYTVHGALPASQELRGSVVVE